ncbi:hypothetical protein [Celeribacter sp.]|uniref:hypothetical protein n=1 Tax=Celeribacter sp. TaxID=1890673 RepID=UPI003A8F7778
MLKYLGGIILISFGVVMYFLPNILGMTDEPAVVDSAQTYGPLIILCGFALCVVIGVTAKKKSQEN